MPQQKGMKRAVKVLARKQKVTAKKKIANIRKAMLQAEAAEHAHDHDHEHASK